MEAVGKSGEETWHSPDQKVHLQILRSFKGAFWVITHNGDPITTVLKRERIQESSELLCYDYSNMNLILKLLTILLGVEERRCIRNTV